MRKTLCCYEEKIAVFMSNTFNICYFIPIIIYLFIFKS